MPRLRPILLSIDNIDVNLHGKCIELGGNDLQRKRKMFMFILTNLFTNKGMVRSDMSKPALIFFSLHEHTQQNPLSKF
jgi:hypothetical protein